MCNTVSNTRPIIDWGSDTRLKFHCRHLTLWMWSLKKSIYCLRRLFPLSFPISKYTHSPGIRDWSPFNTQFFAGYSSRFADNRYSFWFCESCQVSSGLNVVLFPSLYATECITTWYVAAKVCLLHREVFWVPFGLAEHKELKDELQQLLLFRK